MSELGRTAGIDLHFCWVANEGVHGSLQSEPLEED